MNNNKTLSIIGAGKVGTAIGCSLKKKGYKILKVFSKHLMSAQKAIEYIGEGKASDNLNEQYEEKEDLVFITTPDDLIEPVCREFLKDRSIKEGCLFIHCSGVLSSQALKVVKEYGGYIGSIHPLQTFADISQALNNLPGVFWGIEGEQEVIPKLGKLVKDMNGICLTIFSEDKPLYHAAAVIASNYLVTLVNASARLFEKVGIPKEKGLQALLPLLKGTINNLESLGIPGALTGPIVRGDIVTIRSHLRSMQNKAEELLEFYRLLGMVTVEIAEAKGSLDKEKARLLMDILNTA